MNLLKRIFVNVWNTLKEYINLLTSHIEMLVVLILAVVGLNSLLFQIPFLVTLPLWVENTLLISFISSFTVWGLMSFWEYRLTNNIKDIIKKYEPIYIVRTLWDRIKKFTTSIINNVTEFFKFIKTSINKTYQQIKKRLQFNKSFQPA